MNRPVSLRSVTPTPANTHSRHASAQQARHDEAATPTPTTATATATATATTVQSLHPHPTVPLNENVSVVQAAAYMAAKRQDAILVVDNSGELTGILTDKDIAYRVVAEALSPKATPIAAVMTMNPVSVTTESNAADALNKMVAGRFRHLPVVEDMDDDDNDLDLDFAGGLEDAATTLESLRALKASASASPTPATVFAVLDITKALYEALERIERIYDPDATLRAQQDFNDLQFQLAQQQIQHDMQHDQLSLPQHMRSSSTISAAAAALHFIQGLRDQLACPSLAMLIAKDSLNAPMISVTATVLDAVKLMKQAKETAVLVFEPLLADPSRPSGDLAGIFTTKDLVLRVLAAGLDPAKTPVSRVMTPHPDCVHPDTSIIDALKKMHANRYLHLPIMDSHGNVCGMADVLKLTYTILGEIAIMQEDEVAEGGGPMWSKFWETDARGRPGARAIDSHGAQRFQSPYNGGGSETSSHLYPSANQPPLSPRAGGRQGGWEDDRETVLPDDSASAIIPTSASAVERRQQDPEFVFKLKDDISKKVHRFSFSIRDTDGLRALVASKISSSSGKAYTRDLVHVAYVDDEGDTIHLANSRDLEDAVIMARSLGWKRLVIVLDHARMAASERQMAQQQAQLLAQQQLKQQQVLLQQQQRAAAGSPSGLRSRVSTGVAGDDASGSPRPLTPQPAGLATPTVQPATPLDGALPDSEDAHARESWHQSPAPKKLAPAPAPPAGSPFQDLEVVAPIVLVAGLAVIGAFLLGKAFR